MNRPKQSTQGRPGHFQPADSRDCVEGEIAFDFTAIAWTFSTDEMRGESKNEISREQSVSFG